MRGVADRRRHDIGERHRPEADQRLAPALEGAGRGHRLGPDGVLAPLGLLIVGQPIRDRPVEIRPRRAGRRAQPVDDGVAPVGEAEMRHATAEDADHHRLDHAEGEERRYRRVDRVAARSQHLDAGGGGERMVGDDHAARAGGRALVAGEGSDGAGAPGGRGHAGYSRLSETIGIRTRRTNDHSPPAGILPVNNSNNTGGILFRLHADVVVGTPVRVCILGSDPRIARS